MNKKPSFAGSFYPEKPEELTNLLNSFKQESQTNYKSKAIIVPHAGIVYSGYAAMAGFQHLEPNENIFIIAPSHHESFNNIAFSDLHAYFDSMLSFAIIFSFAFCKYFSMFSPPPLILSAYI